MQARYNALRAAHEKRTEERLGEEAEPQRLVRGTRHTALFREEMDRRSSIAAESEAAPVFGGTSTQLTAWRKLSRRQPDVLRRKELLEETAMAAGDLGAVKGMSQGRFLGHLAAGTQWRGGAATTIQRIARGVGPRRTLMEALGRMNDRLGGHD